MCRLLVDKLRTIRLDRVELFVEPVRDYRFVLVLRGEGLGAAIDDTDPGREGAPPLEPVARDAASERTAALLRDFIERAAAVLADGHPANMITLRGIARRPPMPTFAEVYRLRAGAIAVYPMYRGLARLVGMTILPAGSSWAEQVARLRHNWSDYDFFFLHYKYTDAAGEAKPLRLAAETPSATIRHPRRLRAPRTRYGPPGPATARGVAGIIAGERHRRPSHAGGALQRHCRLARSVGPPDLDEGARPLPLAFAGLRDLVAPFPARSRRLQGRADQSPP